MSQDMTNAQLGFPAGARLLIVNADDFGMCHAGNAATIQALKEGVASSTTLMTPCPWAPDAMRLLRENPEIAFGVHLTIVCEFSNYRWGPVASRNDVPSLVDEAGYFVGDERIPELLAQAKLSEIETEFRAQIETVLAAGLKPAHLDWHCLADGGRPDIFDLTFGLAREYGLALRTHARSSAATCRDLGLPASDHGVLDSYSVETAGKSARYVQLLRDLPPGLSEWAVHPSLGDAEARALEPENWGVRRADFDFLISQEAKDVLEEEQIILTDFRGLQAIWSTSMTGRDEGGLRI